MDKLVYAQEPLNKRCEMFLEVSETRSKQPTRMNMREGKLVTVSFADGNNRRLQLTPDEAWKLVDGLRDLLIRSEVPYPGSPTVVLTDGTLEHICPWCGEPRESWNVLCNRCHDSLDPDTLRVIDSAIRKHRLSDKAIHKAVYEIRMQQ